MIEHKAYAQAANYFSKYSDVSVDAKMKLARCQYWMKEPLVCASVYSNIQADSLKDVDRYYYADVLWQLGKESESRAVGTLIKNDILKSVVDEFQNFNSDSLLMYNTENTVG